VCETWATTKTDEKNLARFERKVLRQIFGPRRNQNTGEYERRKNEEVINMLEDPDIIATMKSKRISWAGHVYGEAESRQLVKSPILEAEEQKTTRPPKTKMGR